MMYQIAPIASIIMSVVSVISVIYLGAYKMGRLEVKVDTMWDFQMRRAFSEAVNTGVGTMNSPLQFVPEAMEKLECMKPALQDFWAQNKLLPMNEFVVKLENNFGTRIMEEVCIPLGLSHGACLLMAAAAAKNVESIDLDDFIISKLYH